MSSPQNPRRRLFLKGAAGFTVALPLLHALGARARAEQVSYPKRLLLFYSPNGTVHEQWFPLNPVSETEFDLNQIHTPLLPFKDKLLIFRGIDLKVTALGPGGPHQRGIGALFTGRELLDGTFVDGCGSQAGWANGISVDQAVANQIAEDTPIKSLELAVRALESDVQSRISYSGPGQPLPPLNDPRATFLRVFGRSGGSPDGLEALAVHRRSVLDVVREQFAGIENQVGSADRTKLGQHLEFVRDMEQRLGAYSNGSPECRAPELPPPLDANSEDDMPATTKLQLDMIAMAFACDLTRVASLQISTAQNRIRFPWLNSLGVGHNLSHTGPSDSAAQAELVSRATWHAEQLAYLLHRLQSIPEGDGSVLDNTLVLWGNEVSRGNTHSHEQMPFLIVGTAGGALRTGRVLSYDHASHNDLLVSVQNAMGVPASTFGHPDYCTGPLPGLV